MRWRPMAALTLGLLGLVGCAPSPLPDGERRVALRETTEQVILPTYLELSDRTAELAALLEELAAAPDSADLRLVRAAYLAAREPLQEAEAFGFGPAEEPGARASLDQWPIDAAKVDAALESDQELTRAFVRSLGANKRGLHAVEYLLFPEDDAELEAALLSGETAGERRREFAALAARVVAEEAERLRLAWAPEDGDYAGKFSRPGGADSVSPDVQAGLDTMLNQVVVVTEVIANVKLGKPLGLETGKVSPEAQESARAGAALRDMLANLRGVRNVYLASRDGSRAVSLSSLVHAKSPAVDARARAALDDAEQALRDIPEPFTAALVEEPKKVQAAFDAVKAHKRVLATEALGTLGASLKFSDNDGD